MPTVGSAPGVDELKAPRASMRSLPAFAYAVASGKTKNGAPLPTRFWTAKSRVAVPSGTVVPSAAVRNVTFMMFGAAVGNRLADVLLTVPMRIVFTLSSAPTAKPAATHEKPTGAVRVAVVPSEVI